MQIFKDLGAAIERRWQSENYQEEMFPDIATEALEEANVVGRVNPWEIVRWVFQSADLPNQRDVPGKFGDPPITLYDGPRFYIDAYYWLDGTTSIHQHSFCGAFQLLAGSSIHSSYKFDVERRINQHFITGKTTLEQVELLERGAVRPIIAGPPFVHALFHLDRPSVTICIRTQHTTSGPQFDYRKPHFAVDPFFVEPVSNKRIHSASLLLRARHHDSLEMIGELLQQCDFQTAFSILQLAKDHFAGSALQHKLGVFPDAERFAKLVEAARKRHGELVDMALEVFDEAVRENNIIQRRSRITHPDHRFFLALLLNVPDRVRLLAMVHQRFPNVEPVSTILSWIEELATTKLWDSDETNVLG